MRKQRHDFNTSIPWIPNKKGCSLLQCSCSNTCSSNWDLFKRDVGQLLRQLATNCRVLISALLCYVLSAALSCWLLALHECCTTWLSWCMTFAFLAGWVQLSPWGCGGQQQSSIHLVLLPVDCRFESLPLPLVKSAGISPITHSALPS